MSDPSEDRADGTDIIELLAGIKPAEPVAELRRNRSQARTNAQHSFRVLLGEKLTAALEFAHLLVFRPRDSRPERLAPLAWWGWTPTQVVGLAQPVCSP